MRPTLDLTFISLALAATAYAFLALWTLSGRQQAVVDMGRARLVFVLATCATVVAAAIRKVFHRMPKIGMAAITSR